MNHNISDAQIAGIKHQRIYNKQGQGIGWQTVWLTKPVENPLSVMQMRAWQRKQKQEEHEKNWQEIVQEIKKDDLIKARLKAQKAQKITVKKKPAKNKPRNWTLSPWMKIWKEDPELRELFNNNFLHMRATARRKNYNREWINELKKEQRCEKRKR